MMAGLADYLSEEMFEKIGKSIQKRYQCNYLIKAVQEIEEEYRQAVFENLLHQEEFDWTGLKQYIDDHLLNSICAVFLSPNRDVRRALRKQVYRCAYGSAQADTVAKQRQVDRLLDKVLIQVRHFLNEQQEPLDQMPFHEVTDQICVKLDTWEEEIKNTIEEQTKQLEKQIQNLQKSIHYQHSFAEAVDQIKLPQPIHSLFHYRDSRVGFYGREKEIAYLDHFLDCEEPILFTAVNGPAGAGKSKFLYEYMKGLANNPNWKCVFLQSKRVLEKFVAWNEWEYPVNLLVVIDYAGDYAELIGEWLVSLKRGSCPPKMRIVLLEREGVGKNRNHNNMQEKAMINPMWYERLMTVHSNDDIKEICYTEGENTGFLELSTLSDDAFKQIIADYAKVANKKLSGSDQQEILEYCKTIEKNEQGVSRPRPLILLFIVDAWEQEGKHHRWNIQELSLRIISRYKKHWETTLCEGEQQVFMAVVRLLVYATATGGWRIEDPLPEYLQRDFLAVKQFCGTRKKLKQLFLSVNEKSVWDDILSPLEPDLIGELFVLDYLQNTLEYQEMMEAIHTNLSYFLFISRCIMDYADGEDYGELFGHGLKGLLDENLIMESPVLYAILLRNLIGMQNTGNAIDTIVFLEELARDSRNADNEEIVLEYANGLFNLACDQEVKEAEKTMDKLERLAGDNRYAGNEEIVLVYAQGLFNLANKQEVKEAEKTVDKLERLAGDNRYAGNEEIVLVYAQGLVNLACDQEVKEAEKTVDKLERLAGDSRYAENKEIVLEYAKGLANLACDQEVKEAEKTVDRLERLAGNSRNAGNEEIVLMYANGLVNLVNKQEVEEAEKTVDRLERLARDSQYAGNEEIVLVYVQGLVNLICDQEVEEAEKTVDRLERLARDSQYAGNEEIVLEYAKGLFNLANKQEVKEAEKTVDRLERLAGDNRYAGNEEIVLRYAKGLFNLACDQEVKEAEKTVGRLESLARNSRNAGNEEIVLVYAKGLVNLGYGYYIKQNYEKAESNFVKAYQMGYEDVIVNLCYMIRRREAKRYSPSEGKEMLLPLLENNDPLAMMNMALYLAEYEDDWQGADDMIFTSAETADYSGVIEWWSSLDDLEGLLVMTWLERNNLCTPHYTLKGRETLELLREKYPHIPDWMIESREK